MGVLRLVPVLLLAGCATVAPPQSSAPDEVIGSIAAAAEPLSGAAGDYDSLLTLVGDNRFVLLGESTHGTREFYRERVRLTRRLVEEKGFTVIAVEADWQDAYDVNEFIHGRGADTATEALATFTRFPEWMWANAEVRELVEWLREYNTTGPGRDRPIGFYGMDVYGIADAIDEVVGFLKSDDASAAARAEERYRCLRRYARQMENYGRDVALGRTRTCTAPAAAQLQEFDARIAAEGGHRPGDERLVSAWQSARVVLNGEAYYRTAVAGGVAAWNLRDRHMADTIDALSSHLADVEPSPAKLIVWAHNSHLGDARATDRTDIGELNVGQLMRQRHDGLTVIVGFTTYEGTVLAANEWGGRGQVRQLRPAIDESYAAAFHATNVPAFLLRLRGNTPLMQALAGPRPQRFVGVVYMPGTERQSHYFDTELARQYDAVVHVDRTEAVQPLR